MRIRKSNRNYHLRYSETGEIVSFLKLKELQSLAEDGHVDPADRVRKEGHRTWHLANTVIGLRLDETSSEVTGVIDSPSSGTDQTRNVLLTDTFLMSRGLPEEDREDHVSVTPKKNTKYVIKLILLLVLCLLSAFPIYYYTQHYMKADSLDVPVKDQVVLPQSAAPVNHAQPLADDKQPVEPSNIALSEPPDVELEPKVSTDVTEETSYELAQSEPVPEVLPETPDKPVDASVASSTPSFPPAIAWLISLKPPVFTKYVTIQIKGTVGVVPKDRNGNYTTEFICGYSLDKLLRSLDKKKNINAIIFVIDSMNGDADELADIESVLAEFNNRFSYHAAVIRSGPMDQTITHYCESTCTVSNISSISAQFDADGFVEDETKNEWATKFLRTTNKRLIKPIEDELEIGRFLIDTMNNSKADLKAICSRVSYAQDTMHPNGHIDKYEKQKETYPYDENRDGVIESHEYRWRDSDRLSSYGECQWNRQAWALARVLEDIRKTYYGTQITLQRLHSRWEREMKSKCNTFTHREQRIKLNEELQSKFGAYQIVANSARPCAETVSSLRANLVFYQNDCQ